MDVITTFHVLISGELVFWCGCRNLFASADGNDDSKDVVIHGRFMTIEKHGKNNHLKMYVLLKMAIFQPAMLVYWRVTMRSSAF